MANQDTEWILNVVQHIDMFSTLTMSEVSGVISQMRRYRYAKGQTIVKQGEPGDSFFVIYKGRVEVLSKKSIFKTVKMGELSDGEFFGEMSLLRDQPRNATINAIESTDCFVLFKTDFQTMVKHSPDFANAVKTTSEQRSFELKQD